MSLLSQRDGGALASEIRIGLNTQRMLQRNYRRAIRKEDYDKAAGVLRAMDGKVDPFGGGGIRSSKDFATQVQKGSRIRAEQARMISTFGNRQNQADPNVPSTAPAPPVAQGAKPGVGGGASTGVNTNQTTSSGGVTSSSPKETASNDPFAPPDLLRDPADKENGSSKTKKPIVDPFSTSGKLRISREDAKTIEEDTGRRINPLTGMPFGQDVNQPLPEGFNVGVSGDALAASKQRQQEAVEPDVFSNVDSEQERANLWERQKKQQEQEARLAFEAKGGDSWNNPEIRAEARSKQLEREADPNTWPIEKIEALAGRVLSKTERMGFKQQGKGVRKLRLKDLGVSQEKVESFFGRKLNYFEKRQMGFFDDPFTGEPIGGYFK
jgi:hypothetical protein